MISKWLFFTKAVTVLQHDNVLICSENVKLYDTEL